MLLFCGYNGFQQFNALCPSLAKELNSEIVSELVICDSFSAKIILQASWSQILLIQGNSISICGFHNEEEGKCISVEPPFKEEIVQASVFKDKFLFVTESGKVWQLTENSTWRSMSNVLTAEITPNLNIGRILKVCCGETLTAAISSTGAAFALPNVILQSSGVIDVACGKEHGLLLTENGTVLTWGGGSRGQLGRGDLESSETPCEVEALAGMKIVKIAAGGWHSAALSEDGDLYTWGWNKQGQLGFPCFSEAVKESVNVLATPRPAPLPNDEAFVEDVSCGASHTVIILRDGIVLGCGWNKWGQLGLKGKKNYDKITVIPLEAGISVKKVVCGLWSTFLIT